MTPKNCGVFILAIFFSILDLPAQTAVHFFSDSVQTGAHNQAAVAIHENEFIYVGGQTFGNGYALTPSVTKIDTAGNTLWTYSLNKDFDKANFDRNSQAYGNGEVRMLIMDETAVYAYLTKSKNTDTELWKLDKITGNIVWKRPVPNIISMAIAAAGEMALIYNKNGLTYELINTMTGRTALIKTLWANNPAVATLSFDTDGSAYLSYSSKLFKYNSPHLNTLLWEKQLVNAYVTNLIPKGDGSIYIMGNRQATFGEAVIAGRINKVDGTTIWLSQPENRYYTDERITDFKISDNYIYATSMNKLVGSVFPAYHIWKFNRLTGQHIFDKAFNPHAPPDNHYAAALSLVVDPHDNIYVTGFEKADSYWYGDWGICKFNAEGTLVYNQKVYDGTSYPSQQGHGLLNFILNNRIYNVGVAQSSAIPGDANLYVMSVDTGAAPTPGNLKKAVAYYQQPSAVKQILPYLSSKYVVYSQLGNGIKVELKNARNGNTIWQKNISRGAYLAADKIVITADQKILLSCIRYGSLEMRFDYNNAEDSIYFIKIDSLGAIKFDTAYTFFEREKFVPIQLYAGLDSMNIYAYSMKDDYLYDSSIHFFNIESPKDAFATFGTYISSFYMSIRGRQELIIPKKEDSAVHVTSWLSGGTKAIYRVFKFTDGRHSKVENSVLDDDLVVQNLIKYDSSSFVYCGRERLTSIYKLGRREFNQTSVAWLKKQPAGQTIEGISASQNCIYVSGTKAGSLIISSLDANDGTQRWEKILTPTGTNRFYVPLDQKYNPVKDQYTVCGYIGDSTQITYTSQPFYVTVDTLGNIIKEWSKAPDFNRDNQLNTIAVSPAGQTLIGGALFVTPHGRSAVLIEADTAIKTAPDVPIIVANPKEACAGETITLTASSPDCDGCTYQWNDPLLTVGEVLTVSSSGNYQVTVSNGVGTAIASRDITIKPLPTKPVITATVDSLMSSSTSGNQWFHNGNAIPGATDQFYRPTADGLYMVQVTENGCSNVSDIVSFIVSLVNNPTPFDGKVIIAPNPIGDKMTVINQLDNPLEIRLFDAMGNMVLFDKMPPNTSREFFVGHLTRGVYLVQMTDIITKLRYTQIILKQ